MITTIDKGLPVSDIQTRCCRASEMVAHFAAREPVTFATMLGDLNKAPKSYDDYCHLLMKLTEGQDQQAFAKTLRRFRLQQHVELVCRDVLDQIDVETMLLCLSDLASVCLNVTYDYVYASLAQRYGIPLTSEGQQQHLSIFGMGKLGGGELNFSSDIDLILAYPEKGVTKGNVDGEKVVDNELFFHRLAQKLIWLLDNYDENGFVYRVDMRLKPFGSVGTLCTTFEAMQRYYLNHGRNWERYALVKMRPVAGDIASGQRLIEDLAHFIYQRHVDYEAVSSIEEMKNKVVAHSQEKNLRDNLKLGHGGIREIEFLVQTFQMMYGGRMLELRGQSLLAALDALQAKELLTQRVCDMLRANYLRLRKIENAIQYYRDQQTHDLPNKSEPRSALLAALAVSDWMTLVNEVNRVRFEVFELFKRVFAAQDGNSTSVDQEKLDESYWLDLIYQTDITRGGAETIARDFVNFYQSMYEHDLGERYLIRLNWVLPQVIVALDGEENPVKIAKHMLELLRAIADESVYLSLLVEHPSVLKKIMHLFMHSEWMTRFLCKHPRVIDELIHENYEQTAPDDQQIQAELDVTIAQCVDTESLLAKLIDFKHAMMFRTASADMQNKIRLLHVSDQLTWTAEAIIKTVLARCLDEMYEQYGKPMYQDDQGEHIAEFGIIAYGKLGGLEMGYGSDLDLVFLHSSHGEAQMTDGQRSIENDVFFTRLVGKFNRYMMTQTSNGKLFEIDVRLRPSGQSGLLVHRLSAFEQYLQEKAWTWEHQALVRARFVAGDAAIEKGFKHIRQQILGQPRDPQALRDDIINMREKMHQSHKPVKEGMVHVKHDAGGVVDIEFIVQYLILKHSKDHRHLVRCSDNTRQLAALELFGILRSADASDLRAAYRQFRFWIHHHQLLGQRAVAPDEKFARRMADVRRIWRKILAIDTPDAD